MLLTYYNILKKTAIPDSDIYILQGEDDFILKDVEKRVVKKFLNEDATQFNYQRLRIDKDSRASHVISLAAEYPVGSEKRILTIENIGGLKAPEGERLAKYLEGIEKEGKIRTVLIIFEGSGREYKKKPKKGKKTAAKEPPPRQGLKEYLGKKAVAISCSLARREIFEILEAIIKGKGKLIKRDALNLIIDRAGQDYWTLRQEVNKLLMYAKDKKEIDRKHVEEIISIFPTARIFNLTSSLGKRDVSETLGMIEEIARDSSGYLMVLSSLNNHLRFLLDLSEAKAEGKNSQEITRDFRKSSYWIEQCLQQASAFSQKDFKIAFRLFANADVAIKTGKDPRLVTELVVIQISRSLG